MAAEQDDRDELFAYTLSHGAPEFIHQYVVDAWAAQHAGADSKPIMLTFALMGLYLHLERNFTGKQVQRAHMEVANRTRVYPPLVLPVDRGTMTAADVLAAPPGPGRDSAIEAWCASVWAAHHENRSAIIEWLDRNGIRASPAPARE